MSARLSLPRRLLRTQHLPTRPFIRTLQTSPTTPANPLPITAHGPAPGPPIPEHSPIADLRARQKKAHADPKSRFWKTVNVTSTPEGYNIQLDNRLVKTPVKKPLTIPASKPFLANAIALEWSHLRTNKDAHKTHLVPLTQLASRAIDIRDDEREGIVQNLIRYLDTDTVLCWAPTIPEAERDPARKSLRELQIEEAMPIMGWLTARVWRGLTIHPQDGDEGGLYGKPQDAATRETLLQWMRELGSFELVGFERIVLAAKSFLIGARMVEEWREGGERKWGVEEAARAASVEVDFQTRTWGEVDDTHDVEKQNIKRQIGAGWLLVYTQAEK